MVKYDTQIKKLVEDIEDYIQAIQLVNWDNIDVIWPHEYDEEIIYDEEKGAYYTRPTHADIYISPKAMELLEEYKVPLAYSDLGDYYPFKSITKVKNKKGLLSALKKYAKEMERWAEAEVSAIDEAVQEAEREEYPTAIYDNRFKADLEEAKEILKEVKVRSHTRTLPSGKKVKVKSHYRRKPKRRR